MHAILSIALPPLGVVSIILGFAGLMWLAFLGNGMFARKMSGWKTVVARFPMTETRVLGDFLEESGIVGRISISWGGFNIRLAAEGVCLHPFFARRSPCLIPWSAIREVSVTDTSLLVTVDYESAFQFFLPAKALAVAREYLPPELFHKAVSPF